MKNSLTHLPQEEKRKRSILGSSPRSIVKTSLNFIKTINCCNREFRISKGEKRVRARPENTQLIHNCGLMAIYQEQKGVMRFYQFRK